MLKNLFTSLIFISLVLLTGFLSLSAQHRKSSVVIEDLESPKIQRIYKKADKSFKYGDYYAALPEFATLVMEKPDNAEFNFKFGVCLLHASYTKKEAIEHLKHAYDIGKDLQALLYLGKAYHLDYQFDEALKTFQMYQVKIQHHSTEYEKSDVKKLIDDTNNAKEMIKNPIDVLIENVGPGINSAYPDYVPLISADDQVMYFTSRRENTTGGKIDHNKEYYEDIYYAQRDSLNGWKPAVHLHNKINSERHDAAAGLSADGHTLIIYRNDTLEGGGDLLITYNRDTTWTDPKIMDPVINTKNAWQPSASLTADEKVMYFTSNRSGGFGGRDLYKSTKTVTGKWGTPVNLGPEVNTPYDEDGPFIHPDGKTLYFSSKGHKNMGGFDIFVTEQLDSIHWKIPENMGYPINTVDDDIYFVITASGEMGYISSHREDGYGEKDIYALHLNLKDKALVVLKGKITNKQNMPLAATVGIYPLGKKTLSGLYNSNSATGKYLSVLLPGKSYKVIYNSEGYDPDTILINCENINSYHEIIKNIKLYKPNEPRDTNYYNVRRSIILSRKILSVGDKSSSKSLDSLTFIKEPKSIVSELEDKKITNHKNLVHSSNQKKNLQILFGFASFELTTEHIAILDDLILPFKHKGYRFELHGYTDSKGTDDYNKKLSRQRAHAVLAYLMKNGFYHYEARDFGHGEINPVAPNETADGQDNPDGRALNRRVEIKFKSRKQK